MEEFKVVASRRWWRECEECGEPAERRITYLLHNARNNPASSGYRGDDISWCSDGDRFSCAEHQRKIEQAPPERDMRWCSTFTIEEGGRHQHMGWKWVKDEKATAVAKEAVERWLEAKKGAA